MKYIGIPLGMWVLFENRSEKILFPNSDIIKSQPNKYRK